MEDAKTEMSLKRAEPRRNKRKQKLSIMNGL